MEFAGMFTYKTSPIPGCYRGCTLDDDDDDNVNIDIDLKTGDTRVWCDEFDFTCPLPLVSQKYVSKSDAMPWSKGIKDAVLYYVPSWDQVQDWHWVRTLRRFLQVSFQAVCAASARGGRSSGNPPSVAL